MSHRRFGRWAGNPTGTKESVRHCIVPVLVPGRIIFQQCSRKRGTGMNGLFCKQHARVLSIEAQAKFVVGGR